MENLFAMLILLSLVLLIIGLISPKVSLFWNKKSVPTRKRSSLIYGITLFVSFVLFGITTDDKRSNKNASVSSNSEPTEKKAVLTKRQLDSIEVEQIKEKVKEREDQTISALDLTLRYEENEVKADEDFKGKTFFVEGTVGDIKKDILNNIYVILEGDQMFRNVQCFFDDKNTASQLQKEMRVTFKGECDGLMMNVVMRNCVLVDNLSTIKKNNK